MPKVNDSFLRLDWPAPDKVRAVSTTRLNGVSEGVYAGLNLGDHVGDDPEKVAQNRAWLQQQLNCNDPRWLNQTHSVNVSIDAQECSNVDAAYTNKVGDTLVVMTADCLPVFICDEQGSEIAVIHAGWRGLCDGVIEKTLSKFASSKLLSYLGPAISQQHFEVGLEVKTQFEAHDANAAAAFKPAERDNHYWCDLYLLAKQRLALCGVEQVFGGDLCSFSDSDRYYSYRRDGITGRMAHLIWLQP